MYEDEKRMVVQGYNSYQTIVRNRESRVERRLARARERGVLAFAGQHVNNNNKSFTIKGVYTVSTSEEKQGELFPRHPPSK